MIFLTLFFCGISIWIFVVQQRNVSSSLVSPVPVLDTRDSLERLDIYTAGSALRVLEGFDKEDFKKKNKSFLKDFREEFLSSLFSDSALLNSFFNGVWDGKRFVERKDQRSFLEKVVYPPENFYFEGDTLVIKRSPVAWKKTLSNFNSKNFFIDFYYESAENEIGIVLRNGKFLLAEKFKT